MGLISWDWALKCFFWSPRSLSSRLAIFGTVEHFVRLLPVLSEANYKYTCASAFPYLSLCKRKWACFHVISRQRNLWKWHSCTVKTPAHGLCCQRNLTASADRPESKIASDMEREPMRLREGYLVKKVSGQFWMEWRRKLTLKRLGRYRETYFGFSY